MKTKAAITAITLLAATSASAQPTREEIFCAELKRVVEVAELGGDFASLERSRAAPPTLGFAHGCRATGDERKQYWHCGQSFAPESLGRDALAGRIAACLPQAVRGKPGLAREASFTLPHARIHISELGGPGAHVGRIVGLVVEAREDGRNAE
jgi:hypothetical protein